MSTYNTFTDKELLSLLKAGEESAFTEIYNRYWKLLYYTAHNIVQDEDSAKDIIQNVFISVWQRRNEVEIKSLKPYLQQATRFLVFKAIRAHQTDAGFYERLKLVTSEIIADDPLLFKEQQQILKELIETIPEHCRETFRLSREEGLTYKQIAMFLNVSEKTVEKRLSKTLKYIREGLTIEMCIVILFMK